MTIKVTLMSESECENLVREATEASKHSLDISAGLFEDAAKCYDKLGDRKKQANTSPLQEIFFLT